jgi:hypothetical protein
LILNDEFPAHKNLKLIISIFIKLLKQVPDQINALVGRYYEEICRQNSSSNRRK